MQADQTTISPKGALINGFPKLEAEDLNLLSKVAVTDDGNSRAGTFILKDSVSVCSMSNYDDLELLPIAAAVDKYDWLKNEYYWGLIPTGKSPLSREQTFTEKPLGYFLRVRQGAKVKVPVQAALYMTGSLGRQVLHNVVILEEDAELELITGCVSSPDMPKGEHIAVSETYIEKNSRLTNTMVHSWSANVRVEPISVTSVGDGGQYISNYISLQPAGVVESNPVTFLNGSGASAKYFSVILGSENSRISIGGDVHLKAENTSAEIAHRAICTGGEILQKGMLIGTAECQAHVDCSGLIITPGKDGYIESVPGLRSYHEEAHMSHEASIGQIVPEQVEYLMAHGMEEREAISLIVRGFLDADLKGLGPELERRISEIAELAGHGG